MRAGMIINSWAPDFRARYGGSLVPDDYFTFDIETSGFHPQRDVILEWGHCLIRERKVVDRASFLINWYDHPDIPSHYLDTQLERIAQAMRVANKTWRITPKLLREEGIKPEKVLPWMYEYLCTVKDNGYLFVSHNGINFDAKRIQNHFQQDLGKSFDFGDDQVFDTGAIEKASQLSDPGVSLPRVGETMRAYFRRIAYVRATGVYWNIEDCVKKYNLVEKYKLDPHKLHSAGEDAYALHCLMEEFRQLSDAAEAIKVSRPLQPPSAIVHPIRKPLAAPARAQPLASVSPKPAPSVQSYRRQRSR